MILLDTINISFVIVHHERILNDGLCTHGKWLRIGFSMWEI